MSNHILLKFSILLATLMLLSTTISAQDDITIQEYNDNYPGFELAFSGVFLPASGSQGLDGWMYDESKLSGYVYSVGGVFYQRVSENLNTYYDIGIMVGYTKMGDAENSELGAREIGLSLRNPLLGVKNSALFQSLTFMAISPSASTGSDVGTGFGLKGRVGYQKPVSELHALTFFIEGQYTQEIRSVRTNFYTVGAGVQINLLFQN